MEPEALIGLIAEPRRMRVFAAVVLGAQTPAEVAERTGLTLRDVGQALRRLADGALVSAGPPLVAHVEAFGQAARVTAGSRPAPQSLDPDRARDAVLQAFISNGRLVSIPAAAGKRRIVLEHLAAAFEPGVKYPEKEVNAVLRAWHPDHAALRRYLVDDGFLSREAGLYWRSGGAVF
jgi:hypothetical protein